MDGLMVSLQKYLSFYLKLLSLELRFIKIKQSLCLLNKNIVIFIILNKLCDINKKYCQKFSNLVKEILFFE